MTSTTIWTREDLAQAQRLWADYQRQHDVSHRAGQAVGIDPRSGRVWFGDSAADIAMQQEEEGAVTPLFFSRVGSDHYVRKGGRS